MRKTPTLPLSITLLIYTNLIGVFAKDFARTEKANEGTFRLKRFYIAKKLLILTITTRIHEQLHTPIHGKLVVAIDNMGLDTGATRYPYYPPGYPDVGIVQETQLVPQDFYAQAMMHGQSWSSKLVTVRVYRDFGMTVRLQNDRRWWFSHLNHKVKIVILAHSEVA